jgi:photosystem II stability/assembly factor-like uncharacterized protein
MITSSSLSYRKAVAILSAISLVLLPVSSIAQIQSRSWERCNRGFDGRSITCLTQNAAGEVFAGASERDLFWSDDRGVTWQRVKLVDARDVRKTTEEDNVISIAIGKDGKVFAGTDRGSLYSVTRDGKSWKTALVASFGGGVLSVVVNALGHVFICADDTCIYRSGDSGKTWVTVDQGIKGLHPSCLALDSAGVLFTGTIEKGVFRSSDNGDHWTSASQGLSDKQVTMLTVGPGNHLWTVTRTGQVFNSLDGGRNWFSPVKRTGDLPARRVATIGPNVYVITQSGRVLRSDDQGKHWNVIEAEGFRQIQPSSLLALREGILLMGEYSDGIYRSTDGAQYWRLSNTGLIYPYVTVLECGAKLVLAGTRGGALYSSTDNGSSWSQATPEWGTVTSVKLDSKGFMYAIVGIDRNRKQQFFRSDDKGKTWSSFQSGLPKEGSLTTLSIGHDGRLLLGTNGSGIYSSDDRGETWQERNTGLPEKRVTCILPSRAQFIFASTHRGVYRSSDRGNTWELIYSQDVPVISILEQDRGKLLAGTNGDGVYLLSGNGLSWEKSDFPALTVLSFMDDTRGTIYATTYTDGIFSSRDGGRTWARANAGLPSDRTTALVRLADGRLLVGTMGDGIFRSVIKKTH